MLQSLTQTLTGILQSFATSSTATSASEVVATKLLKKVKKQRLHSDLVTTSHPPLAATPFSTTYNSDGLQSTISPIPAGQNFEAISPFDIAPNLITNSRFKKSLLFLFFLFLYDICLRALEH